MNYEHYNIVSRDGMTYLFTSMGIKGATPKIVQYEKRKELEINGKDVYNLGFGVIVQLPDGNIDVDDNYKTNNGDMIKFLLRLLKQYSIFQKNIQMPVYLQAEINR